VDCGGELSEILDPLFEQVCAPSAAALRQRENVLRVCVLAEDDDPDIGMRLTQALGRLDALVRAARRHAYVGDDVRALGVDGSEKRREVIAGCDDCKLWPRLEQATDPSRTR